MTPIGIWWSFNWFFNVDNVIYVQVFRDKIVSMADVGAGGEEAVITFDGIAVLTPR